MIGVCNVVINFGHKVPNLKRVGVSRLLYALLSSSMIVFIGVIMMNKGTSFLNMTS